jgi:hypothetical protein
MRTVVKDPLCEIKEREKQRILVSGDLGIRGIIGDGRR